MINIVSITGTTDKKNWKIDALYLDSMDMILLLWMPQMGTTREENVSGLLGMDLDVPTYDNSYDVLSHPATIVNTVEILGGMHDRIPKGIKLMPFSKMQAAKRAPTVTDLIRDLLQHWGQESLRNFPKELLEKIGFFPVELLRQMVPGMVPKGRLYLTA